MRLNSASRRYSQPANRFAARHTPMFDARYAIELMGAAVLAGYDTDNILRRAGIDPAQLNRPGARIAASRFEALLHNLTRLTGDELWLYAEQKIKPGTFRTLCKLLLRCATIGEAIREGAHFYHLLINDFRLLLRDDGATAATLTLTDKLGNAAHRRPLHGTVLLFTYGLMCWLSAKRVPLVAIYCGFEEDSFSGELAKIYRAPMVYGRQKSGLHFLRAVLGWPVVRTEGDLDSFLASLPGAMLVPYRDETSFVDRARTFLKRNARKQLSLEAVAAALSTSPQTLRRRLKDEGVAGFQTLKDDVRRELAFDALAKSAPSIEEVAASLGFSEVSTFYRAFQRWSDWTPGEYRQHHIRAKLSE